MVALVRIDRSVRGRNERVEIVDETPKPTLSLAFIAHSLRHYVS